MQQPPQEVETVDSVGDEWEEIEDHENEDICILTHHHNVCLHEGDARSFSCRPPRGCSQEDVSGDLGSTPNTPPSL